MWRFFKVSLIWGYALALTAPPLFGWGQYGTNGHLTSCCFDFITKTVENRSFIIYLFSFGFVGPVGLICYYYIRLYTEICRLDNARCARLQRINRLLHQQPGTQHMLEKKIRSLKVILLNIVAFLAAWTPFAVVALIGQFSPTMKLIPAAVTVPAVFAKSSTAYMPIIFGICDPQCKRWLLSYFSRFRRTSIVRRELRGAPAASMRRIMRHSSQIEVETTL